MLQNLLKNATPLVSSDIVYRRHACGHAMPFLKPKPPAWNSSHHKETESGFSGVAGASGGERVISLAPSSFLFNFIYLFIYFSFIFISCRLITLQYCSGFCHTLTWISHGFTCVPHPDPPSHLPLHPIPLGLPSAPGLSTCLRHPAWAGDLFHHR